MSQRQNAIIEVDQKSDSFPGDDALRLVLEGLENADVRFLALGEDNAIAFVSKAFMTAVGLGAVNPRSIVGQSFHDWFSADALPPANSQTQPLVTTLQDQSGGDHELVWTRVQAGGWVAVARAESVEEDPLWSDRDTLTDVGNRAYLTKSFDRLRSGDAGLRMIGLFVDLDKFKRVNDTLGHAIGDELLARVADRLKKITRSDDVVTRIGGDEFAILLVDKTPEQAEDVAVRILELISRPFLVKGHHLTVGASIGLACLNPGEETVGPLLQRADIALYESKRQGRGRFHWFDDHMLEAISERQDIESDLRKAVLLEQFELVYQPQLMLDPGCITGFEALLRWNHPTRGTVMPMEFISVSEETGLVLKIGAWVLMEACKAAATWPAHLNVAVNVSPIQFEADGFIETVRAALAKSGLAGERLELEITETALLQSEDTVIANMKALREMGVRISLDDFGIGYSSLNYLRKYPFDKVKIDQSFIREPFADASAHEVVEAVAKLGSALGMNVLAEGVETSEQLGIMQRRGCASIQGFLLSPPIPGAEVSGFMEKIGAPLKLEAQTRDTKEGQNDDK